MRRVRALLIGTSLLAASPASGQATTDHLHHPAGSPAEPDALRIDLAYTNDAWTAWRGGTTRDVRHLDNLDLTLAADLERLAGIPLI